MKRIKLSLLLVFAITLSANRCDSNKNVQSLFDDECPLSYKVEWTIVEDGISVDKQIELLASIAAAAEADANKISDIIGNASATARVKTSFSLSKVIQSETTRKAQVTQDVFDEYIRIRTASCNIWDGIKNGLYGTDEEELKKARKLFTDIQMKFAQLEEKKKNQ